MTKYLIDLIYDKQSGQVEFLIDILDSSRTALDIQDGIEDGTLEKEVIEHIETTWGNELADQVRSGSIGIKCTDTSKSDRNEVNDLLRRHPLGQNKEPNVTNRQSVKEENLGERNKNR